MSKSKWELIEKKLPMIEKWAREGLTEIQICRNIPIGKTTFEKYKKEKPELAERLKAGKDIDIAEIENAFNRLAKGYDYEERKTYIQSRS